jgi:hypothetical protein
MPRPQVVSEQRALATFPQIGLGISLFLLRSESVRTLRDTLIFKIVLRIFLVSTKNVYKSRILFARYILRHAIDFCSVAKYRVALDDSD